MAGEDTHNPHKRDPPGPKAPKHIQIQICPHNKNFIFCFSKKKIAMMDEAKAIVKRTMCNQNPLCCNVWSLLGHLIYWLNLFSFDYLRGELNEHFLADGHKTHENFSSKKLRDSLAAELEPIRTGLLITSRRLRGKRKTKQNERKFT